MLAKLSLTAFGLVATLSFTFGRPPTAYGDSLVSIGLVPASAEVIPEPATERASKDDARVWWAHCDTCSFVGEDHLEYWRAAREADAHMRAQPGHTCIVRWR